MRFRSLFLALMLLAIGPAPSRGEDPPVFLLQFGSQGTGDGQFQGLGGLGLDPSGNVYVTDGDGNRVQKFSPSGAFLGKWGSLGSGPGEFRGPTDVAVAPNGDIYVSDGGNSRIEVFDPSLTFLRQWHTRPTNCLAIDPTGQFIFARTGGGIMQVFSPDSTLITTWTDNIGNYPFGFSVGPSGRVYIGVLNDVRVFDYLGQELTRWAVLAPLMPASAVTTDSGENVYATTAEPSVKKHTSDGTLLSTFGAGGSGPGQFATGPMPDLAIDGQQSVYVEDPSNSRIEKFVIVPTSTVRSTWGGLKLRYR